MTIYKEIDTFFITKYGCMSLSPFPEISVVIGVVVNLWSTLWTHSLNHHSLQVHTSVFFPSKYNNYSFLTVSTKVFTRVLKKHHLQHPVYILNSRPSQRTLSNTPNLTRHDKRIFKKMNKHQALGTITDLLLCFCTEACNWAVGGETDRRSPVCFSRPTFCQFRERCSCSNDSRVSGNWNYTHRKVLRSTLT